MICSDRWPRHPISGSSQSLSSSADALRRVGFDGFDGLSAWL
jgi:hypothetical protein